MCLVICYLPLNAAQWSIQQMVAYRVAGVKGGSKRAQELHSAEKEAAKQRHSEVAKLTEGKRLC